MILEPKRDDEQARKSILVILVFSPMVAIRAPLLPVAEPSFKRLV